MKIRKYTPSDFEGCMAVFDSNLPLYFDDSERDMFSNWLAHCGNNAFEYKSPTYSNAEFDSYEVVEDETEKIVGCGGYYICKDLLEARMAIMEKELERCCFNPEKKNFRGNIRSTLSL